MVSHICPICGQAHELREARAQLAYGRQLTCSPDCESERRRRMHDHPFRPLAATRCEPFPIKSQMPSAGRATLARLTNRVAEWLSQGRNFSGPDGDVHRH